MKNLLSILFIIVILFSCDGPILSPDKNLDEAVELAPATEAMSLSKGRMSLNASAPQGQSDVKIIKNASIQIKVKDLKRFVEQTNSVLEDYSAYITNENQNTYDRREEVNLTVRVPDKQFESLFEALKKLGISVESQSINRRDVTEEFIDVETRLKNRKVLENRYRELLKQTRNVNEILNIERQLNNLRSEIESQEARLKYLNNQVDFSTIHVTAFVNRPFVYEPEEQDSFSQRLLKSLNSGWYDLINGILWIFKTWPIWLLLAVVALFWKRRK